jgi:hypothetical protein
MNLQCRLFILSIVLGCASITYGQAGASAATPGVTPVPTPAPMKVKKVEVYASDKEWCTVSKEHPCEAGIGDRLILDVENLSANINKQAEPVDPNRLVLFLDGRELNGLNAKLYKDSQLVFDLKRTELSSQAWSALLAKPGIHSVREKVEVSIGFPDKQAMPSEALINLRLYHSGWAIAAFIGLLLTLGLFLWLARTTGVIRDSGPPLLSATTRPYSLSRTQAAFWFFLVIGSFIFLYLITGDYNTISDQALVLIGIGTGTALGSAMIDASKNDSANETLSQLNPQQARLRAEVQELQLRETDLSTQIENAGPAATAEDKQALSDLKVQLNQKLAELAETVKKVNDAMLSMSKPASEGFRRDLITDVNGISFHRFQMVVWTLVLGVLFCAGVYSALAMPQFSGTLLALMGISSGTYLGFKIPEQQT